MRLINSAQIEEYIKSNSEEAKNEFFHIIDMLIKNTVENLTKFDISSCNDTRQIGLDGVVEFSGSNKYLGNKHANIEIGTNEDYLRQANEYIEKINPNKNNNFIFITPYRWITIKKSKLDWISEKKKQYDWNDIKIIDASVLEDWLEEDLVTTKYLLNRLNIKSRNIHSIEEKEQHYKGKTEKRIGLDFFNYEDKEYEELLSKLEKEYYNIVAPTKEEGLYVTLYYLKKLGRKDVLIIENEETWNDIIDIVKNSILVPYFYHDENLQTPKSSTNITIFIHDEDEITKNYDYKIKQRTINNLIKCLEEYYKSNENIDSDKVNSIIDKSLGKYMPLKREIFKEKSKPQWYNEEKIKLLLYLFFLNNFRSSDMKLFKDFGLNIDELKVYLNRITMNKDPFIIYYKEWDNYRVINIYDAIDWLGRVIDENDIKCLIKVAKKVLSYIEPRYSLENIDDEYYIENVSTKEYSSNVRFGIIKSLIITKRYLEKNEKVNLIRMLDNIIDEYYDSISSYSEFLNFANISEKLVEFDYEKFLNKVKQSINNKDFKKVFLRNKNTLFSSCEYCNIIWGIEKAINKKEYILDAVEVLALLYEMDINYEKVGNNPLDTMVNVFLGWDNLTCLGLKDKVNLLEKLIHNHKTLGKELLKKILPNNRIYWKPLCKPEFDVYDEPKKIKYIYEQQEFFEEYYKLYIENYAEKLEDLVCIYNETYFISFNCFENIKEKTFKLISISNDKNKYELKKVISNRLRGYKRFHSPAWDLSQKELEYLELVEEKIKYNNPIYDYLYIYSNNSNVLEDNLEQEKQKAMLIIEQNEKSEDILLEEGKKEKYYLVIKDIYEYKYKRKYNIDFIKKLFSKYYNYIVTYLQLVYINEGAESILSIYKDEKLQDLSIDNKTMILSSVGYDELLYREIKTKEQEKIYWKKINKYNGKKDDFVYKKCFEYERFDMCISYICEEPDKYNEKCELLEKMIDTGFDTSKVNYEIKTIFESFYNYKISNFERLAILEIYYYQILENKMYFLSKVASKSPNVVSVLVEILFKDDDGNSINIPNIEKACYNSYAILKNLRIDFDNENSKKWCEEFLSILERKKRTKVMYRVLGQLLVQSAEVDNDDNMYPSKSIRELIEYYNVKSKDIGEKFIIETLNKRGVHNVGIGEEELNLYKKYMEWADKMLVEFPQTSKLLRSIAKEYKLEAKQTRERANYVI